MAKVLFRAYRLCCQFPSVTVLLEVLTGLRLLLFAGQIKGLFLIVFSHLLCALWVRTKDIILMDTMLV